jgi:phosphatidylglycerol:prolipoprotein diacylglycerol transferase
MYPTLYDAILDIFGISIPAFKIVMMFGFWVAVAFLAANWVMTLELKRYEKEGKISARKLPKVAPNPVIEYITNGIIGFIFGFKLVYLAFNFSKHAGNPQGFLLSGEGSWLFGILLALSFIAYKFYELRNEKPIEDGEKYTVHPYMLMGNLTLVAAISGFAGAKLFHHLEYFSQLVDDPMVLFRDPFSGLTYFGGLIGGGIGVLWYASKNGINWKSMLDVGGPAMMLGYGIGRMGCHMSGDGDWGVENLAPKPGWLNWLPDWAWSYSYPNNVHGLILENPVWPTPLYEVIMALIIFGILWSIRKKFVPGVLFCIYFIFAGMERFLIEKIRVNPDQFDGVAFTQAELISMTMIVAGIAGIIYFSKIAKNKSN